MKKYLVFIILILVLSTINVSGLSFMPIKDCDQDSNCIVRENTGCDCNCKEAVNKKYINVKSSRGICPEILCSPCLDSEAIEAKCVQGECKVVLPNGNIQDNSQEDIVKEKPNYTLTYLILFLLFLLLILIIFYLTKKRSK